MLLGTLLVTGADIGAAKHGPELKPGGAEQTFLKGWVAQGALAQCHFAACFRACIYVLLSGETWQKVI